MVIVGVIMGFRSSASLTDWVLAAGLLMLFTLAFSWLSAIMGLFAKSVEGVQWFGFILVFPLTFASSAFVPTASMNTYLRAFADNQPLTHVVDATRALMLGHPSATMAGSRPPGAWASSLSDASLGLSVPPPHRPVS